MEIGKGKVVGQTGLHTFAVRFQMQNAAQPGGTLTMLDENTFVLKLSSMRGGVAYFSRIGPFKQGLSDASVDVSAISNVD